MTKAVRKTLSKELATCIHDFFAGKNQKLDSPKNNKSIEKTARQLVKKLFKIQKPVPKKKSKPIAKPKKKSSASK